MTMSMVTRSGFSSRNKFTACTPSSASPATANPALVKMSRSVFLMNSASSTMSTRLWGMSLSLHQVVDGPLQLFRIDQLHRPLRGFHLRVRGARPFRKLACLGGQIVNARHLAHVDAHVPPRALEHHHFTFRTRRARLQALQRPEVHQARHP